jgi:hypothetical protein
MASLGWKGLTCTVHTSKTQAQNIEPFSFVLEKKTLKGHVMLPERVEGRYGSTNL